MFFLKREGMSLDVVFRKRAPVGRIAAGALPFGKRTVGGGDGSASERQGVRGLWRGGQGRVGGFFGMHVSRRRDGKGGVVSLRAIRRSCRLPMLGRRALRCERVKRSGRNGRCLPKAADVSFEKRVGRGGGAGNSRVADGRALPAFFAVRAERVRFMRNRNRNGEENARQNRARCPGPTSAGLRTASCIRSVEREERLSFRKTVSALPRGRGSGVRRSDILRETAARFVSGCRDYSSGRAGSSVSS